MANHRLRMPLFPFRFWSSAATSAASQNADESHTTIAKGPSRFPSMEISIGNHPSFILPPPIEHRVPDKPVSTAHSPKRSISGNVQIDISSSHRTRESRSPSQPLSPSQMASNTPQMASQPKTPSQITPGSPTQTSNDSPKSTPAPETSPRKEQRISSQESRVKPDTKNDGNNSIKAQATDEPNKSDSMEAMLTNAEDPVQGEHKSQIGSEEKPDDEVKQELQEKISEADEEEAHKPFDLPKSFDGAQMDETSKILKSDTEERSAVSDAQKKATLPAGGDHSPLQNGIKNFISKFIEKMTVADPKEPVYNKHGSVMINLVGKNKGASMEIGSDSSETEAPFFSDEIDDAAIDRDGNSAEKRTGDDAKATEDQPETYVNNNAQGINNSVVFDVSITERNPGVRMSGFIHVPE
ncbi:uncharacterized protein LOC127246591 [Andrographis paniculata]|uniref:uncharacterized protein LOC127246591 n=1 Tax=Andrographis paniculata TaxID=175694 RepID=UPI0021E890DC|nr:uncharacterized protein LOC127246591 [Andrographis paniculata]